MVGSNPAVENTTATAFMLIIDGKGCVTGANVQSVEPGASCSFDDGSILVPPEIYNRVLKGMDSGLQFRYVHGDLVCDGSNVSALKRRCVERLNATMRTAVQYIQVRVSGRPTLVIQAGDISLITLALQLGDKVNVRDIDYNLLELNPEEVQSAARQMLGSLNLIRKEHAHAVEAVQKSSDASEINTITERTIKRIEEA